jgi:hypothetical protein
MAVRAFWPEQGVRVGAGRIKSLTSAIERSTRLADVTELEFAQDWVR